MYPQNLCVVYDTNDLFLFWFRILEDNRKLMDTILFMAEAFSDLMTTGSLRSGSSNLLAKILRSLQGDMQDPIVATMESTIYTIASLATIADVLGDVESSRKHIRGLHSVVALRGGIGSLATSQLQAKCCRYAPNWSL